MHSGSLNSSLFGLLAGLAPGGVTPAPATAATGLSFVESLQSALALVPAPAAPVDGPPPAGEDPWPVPEDASVATEAVELEVAPLLTTWVPPEAEVAVADGNVAVPSERSEVSAVSSGSSVASPSAPASVEPAPPRELAVSPPQKGATPWPATIAPATVVVLATDDADPATVSIPEIITLEGASLDIEPPGEATFAIPTSKSAAEPLPATPGGSGGAEGAAALEIPQTEPAPVPPAPSSDEAPAPSPRAVAEPEALPRSQPPSTPMPSVPERGRPVELLRSLTNILPRDVEIQADRVPRERPVVGAATLVRDLGQSLATRSALTTSPRSEAPAPAVTPSPAPVPVPFTAMAAATSAVATTDPSTVVATSAETSPAPHETVVAAPPAEAPVDRDAPLRQQTPAPAPTERVPAASENGTNTDTGRQDSDSSSEGTTHSDPAPMAAPPTPVDAAPAPVPNPGPSMDLQMQARQAVARVVVRMGEDQLLASARPTGVRIQLSPSHLGQIQIEVSQNPQRGLDVTIHAAVEETQRALEADADDMLDSLRSQKLDVTRVSVRGEGDRSDGDPRQRSDSFRSRDQAARDDSSTADGEGKGAHDRGGQSRGGQQPPHADPTDYRYWEAIR